MNSTKPNLVVLKGGLGIIPQKMLAKISTKSGNLDTFYELIGFHIEVHSGGTIRGIPECIKICII